MVTLFTVHVVLCQFVPPVVVTVTAAVIDADGSTVTLADPFSVIEFMVFAAKTGAAMNSKIGINSKNTKIYFRQKFDIENLTWF